MILSAMLTLKILVLRLFLRGSDSVGWDELQEKSALFTSIPGESGDRVGNH